MNFVGHVVAAQWQSTSPAFGFGAMLPDFATMCQARLVPPRDPAVAAGVAHHHRTDAAFHRLPQFLALYKEATRRLGRAGLARGPARGAAHVVVELALDGELVRHEAWAEAYLEALAHGHPSQAGQTLELAGWPLLHERLSARGVPHGYRDPTTVARIVAHILADRPLLALGGGDEARLRGELPRIQERVAAEAEAIMRALASRLQA